MNGANTITDLIGELRHIQMEMAKGSQALFDAEAKLANAEAVFERMMAITFLESDGTAGERTARAKLDSADYRLEADLCKAQLNRVKSKMKTLELQQMGIQTISRLVETELKTLR